MSESGRLHTREQSGLRLDRQLRWWHDGQPVEHPNIVRAFNAGLEPTDDGRFILKFGWDWCYVEVEDAAYLVLAVDAADDGGVWVRLSDRTAERLDPATLRLAEGVLECGVKGQRAKARFSRDAQFEIGQWLQPHGATVVLQVGARRAAVPNVDAAALLGP